MTDILRLAQTREVPVARHSRLELSRISKNGKQDQGVALDILMPHIRDSQTLLEQMRQHPLRLIALDNITNPQNLGMILRSVCAGGMDGIIIPKKGCARLDALVIKASAGTFFRTPIYQCEKLSDALQQLQAADAHLYLMDANASTSLFKHQQTGTAVYVLGNETEGVSEKIKALPHQSLGVPMANNVESLNVAMAATLIAYQSHR